MEWNVFYYNCNAKRIEIFNIFRHGGFSSYVKKHLVECKTKEEFAEALKRELLYYFWSKSEYEVIITSWVGGDREKDATKIDIFQQVMLNFEVFVDYVWNCRARVLEE